jgi:hypothetical protein
LFLEAKRSPSSRNIFYPLPYIHGWAAWFVFLASDPCHSEYKSGVKFFLNRHAGAIWTRMDGLLSPSAHHHLPKRVDTNPIHICKKSRQSTAHISLAVSVLLSIYVISRTVKHNSEVQGYNRHFSSPLPRIFL